MCNVKVQILSLTVELWPWNNTDPVIELRGFIEIDQLFMSYLLFMIILDHTHPISYMYNVRCFKICPISNELGKSHVIGL